MSNNPEPSRREFLSSTGKIVVGEALLSIPGAVEIPGEAAASPTPAAAKSRRVITEFHYGASVYPELQTRAEWNAMLDHFQRAQMNCVRVSESSWGNLETASGHYDFGWLQNFLDDLEKRKMRAILGTGSYVPPQWLAAAQAGDSGTASPRRESASHGAPCALPEPSPISRRPARVHSGSGQGVQGSSHGRGLAVGK